MLPTIFNYDSKEEIKNILSKFSDIQFVYEWEDIDPFGLTEFVNALYIISHQNKSQYLFLEQYVYRGFIKDPEFKITDNFNSDFYSLLKSKMNESEFSLEVHSKTKQMKEGIDNF